MQNLEDLIMEMNTLKEDVQKRTAENQKSVLRNTMNDEVRKFIQESVTQEEMNETDEFEETEVEVDSETGDSMDDTDNDTDFDVTDLSDEEDTKQDGEDAIDLDVGMEDEDEVDFDMEGEDDEEVVDLSNATEEEAFEKIKDVLANLDDEEDIELTLAKKPSYEVNVSGGVAETEEEFDSEEVEDDEDEVDFDMENDSEDSMDEMEDMNEEETMEEASCKDEKVYEADNMEESEHVKEMQAENLKLKKMVTNLIKENKGLKAVQVKSAKTLKEAMKQMNELAITNANLAHVSRLFTENTTTKKEKAVILKKFDDAKTVRESKLIFKMLQENLSKRTSKLIGETKMKKDLEDLKESTKETKKVIKEEKTYQSPEHAQYMRFFDYEPK